MKKKKPKKKMNMKKKKPKKKMKRTKMNLAERVSVEERTRIAEIADEMADMHADLERIQARIDDLSDEAVQRGWDTDKTPPWFGVPHEMGIEEYLSYCDEKSLTEHVERSKMTGAEFEAEREEFEADPAFRAFMAEAQKIFKPEADG